MQKNHNRTSTNTSGHSKLVNENGRINSRIFKVNFYITKPQTNNNSNHVGVSCKKITSGSSAAILTILPQYLSFHRIFELCPRLGVPCICYSPK